jgi:tetratricopeptide (TPR) repeat protein
LPRVTASDVEQRLLDLWDFGDPAGSAVRFRDEADRETDPAAAAVLRTQQARATGLAGDFAAAALLLDGIESSSAGEPGLHVRARIAIERGRILSSTGEPAAAARYFDEAYALATRAGAPGLAVDALHMQAITAGATEGKDASLALNERALAEVEASADPQARRWLGSVLNNLGWDLHDSGRPDEALPVFERAVSVRAESGSHEQWVVARWCVGRTLRTLGRYDEALALMRELAADPVGAEDAYVHEEIAANEKALGS